MPNTSTGPLSGSVMVPPTPSCGPELSNASPKLTPSVEVARLMMPCVNGIAILNPASSWLDSKVSDVIVIGTPPRSNLPANGPSSASVVVVDPE